MSKIEVLHEQVEDNIFSWLEPDQQREEEGRHIDVYVIGGEEHLIKGVSVEQILVVLGLWLQKGY